jgi:hypothetical protein
MRTPALGDILGQERKLVREVREDCGEQARELGTGLNYRCVIINGPFSQLAQDVVKALGIFNTTYLCVAEP